MRARIVDQVSDRFRTHGRWRVRADHALGIDPVTTR